jgi:hypothetical protein
MRSTQLPRATRWAGFVALAMLVSAPALGARALKPEVVAAWSAYAAATEHRIARELATTDRFLALDFRANRSAARSAILGGAIVVEPVETVDARGGELEVPAAMVHHWRGAVLIPGARLDSLVTALQNGAPGLNQEDVLQSRVLARGPATLKLYLRVQRQKFVTVVYNTEHVVKFARHGPSRASSASTATKIAEVESPGTKAERELAPGDDRGFLWKLNAYWRYEQTPAGVIAECESISLSRDIPYLLRYLVTPLVASTAREALQQTLLSMKTHFANR